MNTALQTFHFQDYKLRIESDEHGNPWFCAKDVCDILGYTNSSKAIKDHCKAKGVTNRYPLQTDGGTQYPTFIDEGNLYRLIIKSNKPESEPFESWVCDEVLPAIRKTGGYATQATVPFNEHLQLQAKYIALLEQQNHQLQAPPTLQPVRRLWTAAETAQLWELKAQGLGASKIGKAIGRTESSVRSFLRMHTPRQGGVL